MTARNLLTAVLASLLLTSCVKSGPEGGGMVPASMRAFSHPYATVWKVLTDTVQYDFLIPIEVAEPKRGYFSSEMIKDYQPGQRSRYRVSGSALFDGSATVVKLYKQLEVEQNEAWVTLPSDLSLESRILDAVSAKLRAK